MKKIAIASIFRTGNYGATLQAFALMKAININGYGDASIINYCCDAIRGKINISFIKKAGIKGTIAAIIDKACYFPRMHGVMSFIDSYVSGEELSKKELQNLNSQYDIFLTGSDQLWNPEIQQGDYFYLLDFVSDDSKKRSYGSSFGVSDLQDQYVNKYVELLSKYKHITVRENKGADLVEKLIGTRPEVVLDPVFLLDKDQWEGLLPENGMKGKYIFTYRMAYSHKLTEVVSTVQGKTGYKVFASPFLLGRCSKSKAHPAISSLQWVKAIHDSECVITDSFHGVVFSIIFSKEFYYVVTSQNVKNRLSRLETILGELGINNRIVYSPKDCNLDEKIDYEIVQEKLSALRARSINILKELTL